MEGLEDPFFGTVQPTGPRYGDWNFWWPRIRRGGIGMGGKFVSEKLRLWLLDGVVLVDFLLCGVLGLLEGGGCLSREGLSMLVLFVECVVASSRTSPLAMLASEGSDMDVVRVLWGSTGVSLLSLSLPSWGSASRVASYCTYVGWHLKPEPDIIGDPLPRVKRTSKIPNGVFSRSLKVCFSLPCTSRI